MEIALASNLGLQVNMFSRTQESSFHESSIAEAND